MAVWIRLGLVTVRSSPTICRLVFEVIAVQASQSSWSKGSSIDTMGKPLMNSWYKSKSFSDASHLDLSDFGFLKSKSYLPINTLSFNKKNVGTFHNYLFKNKNTFNNKCFWYAYSFLPNVFFAFWIHLSYAFPLLLKHVLKMSRTRGILKTFCSCITL